MTTDRPRFLAIDQGGHSTRVLATDAAGRVVASHAVPLTTRVLGGRAEQCAQAVVDSVYDGIHRVGEALRPGTQDVLAAGLAVQRASVVCWDRADGNALTPVLSWLDRRGSGLLDGIGLAPDAVRDSTGLHLSPHYGASKLAWCLREMPTVQRAAREGRLGLGPLSSYLVWQLSGGDCYRVDATTAQRTLLWDRHTGDWSPELCSAFGIPLDALPEVVACDAGFGHFALGAARVPLAICAGDQGLVLSAYGMPDPQTVSVNAGTGAFVLTPLETDAEDVDPGLLRTLAWRGAGGARWAEEGTVNGAAAALDRLERGVLPTQEGTAGSEPMFLNGVGGLGAPWWIADYPSRFIGTVGDAAQRERLVIESIVFLVMANVERMHGAPERVLLTGGLSRRSDLRQWLSDALGLPVDVPEDPEATTRGLLAVLSPSLAAREAQRIRIEPRLQARWRWRERYVRWQSALLDRG